MISLRLPVFYDLTAPPQYSLWSFPKKLPETTSVQCGGNFLLLQSNWIVEAFSILVKFLLLTLRLIVWLEITLGPPLEVLNFSQATSYGSGCVFVVCVPASGVLQGF